jgi:hypothetical protein
VTVTDETAPALTLPGTLVAEATGPTGASVTYSATAVDVVDGSVAVNCDHSSGATFALGDTIVNCSAFDSHGNTSTGSFIVTVRDTTSPQLVLAPVTAEATGPAGAS